MTDLTPANRRLLVEARVAAEASDPLAWYYLSFADGSRPEGERWLGGAIVRANGPGTAVVKATALGINPGGEALILEIPPELVPPKALRHRLLSREELVVE